MKKTKRRNKIITNAIVFLLVTYMLFGTVMTAFANEVKIVTLGADLSDDQRTLILNYFNVKEEEVKIITVNNEDERYYLDGIATQQQIGNHTYSCTYIEPTHEGGIHIKTANLTWVTCDMLRNALVTSGITNCNIIAVAPIQVSGTGSLTGIFKAYEELSGETLDEEKKELASEELITTVELSETIGKDNATNLFNELKQFVIENTNINKDDIANKITEYIEENNIEISEEQKWQLVELLLKFSKQDYNIDEVKKSYQDIKQTISDIKEAAEQTKNIIEKIIDWFKMIWQKITGTYEEIKQTEEYQMITEQLGIIAQTNDELLGDSTVVTTTEDSELVEDIQSNNTDINNNLNDSVTFEDFSNIEENNDDIEEDNSNLDDSDNTDILQYITYELLNYTDNIKEESDNIEENNSVTTFDDLFK